MTYRLFACVLLLVGVFACGDDDGTLDAGADAGVDAAFDAFVPEDAFVPTDAMLEDGFSEDAGTDAFVPTDAPIAEGFGALAGPCGTFLADELDEATPSFFVTRLDFMDDPYDDPEDRDQLTTGGQTIMEEGSLGGSSVISEGFAFEALARCHLAELVKTERFIRYEPMDSKKTDILVAMENVELGRVQVGVSVVRAVGFPRDDPYPTAEAMRILDGKLRDILVSSANVVEEDAWVKQILVVLAYADMHADQIRSVWDGLGADVRADTIVYVVITDGDDIPVYF